MFFGLKYVPEHPIYRIHEALEAFLRKASSEDAFNEELFPDWFRAVVARSGSLRLKFEEIFNSLQLITEAEKKSVLKVFLNNNEIERLCEDKSYRIEALADNLDEVYRNLRRACEHLYDHTLQSAAFKVEGMENAIKDHYIKFRNLNSLVCPFCNLENYPDKESGTRASYDHYLNRAKYPFSCVNFKNLVPMCRSCNEALNKGSKNILHQRGRRRQVYYPYGVNSGINLRVQCTKKPAIDDNEGKWNIEIRPNDAGDAERLETWNEVFSLVRRLEARVKEKHSIWVRDHLAVQFNENVECNPDILRSAFDKRARSLADPYFIKHENESVLKRAFFEFLGQQADDSMLEGYSYHCTSPYIYATASRGEFLTNL